MCIIYDGSASCHASFGIEYVEVIGSNKTLSRLNLWFSMFSYSIHDNTAKSAFTALKSNAVLCQCRWNTSRGVALCWRSRVRSPKTAVAM